MDISCKLQNTYESRNNSSIDLARSIRDKLAAADNVLLVGVGGGNDSVTSLLLPAQFERDFGFKPKRLQVAAMLPDVLQYSNLSPLVGSIISEITPFTTRSIGGRVIKEFPEPLLASHKDRFGIERIIGFSMAEGTAGLCSALHEFIQREDFDLVLACDVGGDFIATPNNLDVLSPMMDAYALNVFRTLQSQNKNTEFLYSVFGLGTDGESTPEQLREALNSVKNYTEGKFDSNAVANVNDFYRTIIEYNRKSRTADFTLRSIHGEHLEPTIFRARFHTQLSPGQTKKYYGEFMHAFGEEFSGRYYLFEDLEGVRNPFEFHCTNGIEWFVGIQNVGSKLNHELNGQSYTCMEDLLGLTGSSHSIFFGTPSSKFLPSQREQILCDVAMTITNGLYDTALILVEDSSLVQNYDLAQFNLNSNLNLLTRKQDKIPNAVIELLQSLHSF